MTINPLLLQPIIALALSWRRRNLAPRRGPAPRLRAFLQNIP